MSIHPTIIHSNGLKIILELQYFKNCKITTQHQIYYMFLYVSKNYIFVQNKLKSITVFENKNIFFTSP